MATAFDGLAALDQWRVLQPELIILDLNLPKLDGIGVCKEIRASAATPILILSVRNSDEAVVQGLGSRGGRLCHQTLQPQPVDGACGHCSGALEQPLRQGNSPAAAWPSTAAGLSLSPETGSPCGLTGLELRLLETLFLHAGQVLTADALIGAVWGVEGGDRTMLKQLVYRLRTKLEAEAPGAVRIEAVPGIGYALVEVSR